jgi:hypothetical protein
LTQLKGRTKIIFHTISAPVGFAGGRFSLEQKMNDAAILTLVDRLERCLLDKADFHHRDHLAVAAVYLYAADFDTALDRMRATLLRFSSHHGVGDRYHETLTRFWMEQVEKLLDRELCLQESVRRVQAALPDKDLPFAYYRKETLASTEARTRWVKPDLLQGDKLTV